MNMNELTNLRRFYPIDNSLKKFEKSKESRQNKEITFTYITDEEILEKVNSGDFKKHPIYPVIVKYNGKEIYDLRDNLKLEIRRNKQGSKICRILGFGKIMMSRITAESWYNRLIGKEENIHHKDENKDNNYFKNLVIINKEKHVELHRKKKKKS